MTRDRVSTGGVPRCPLRAGYEFRFQNYTQVEVLDVNKYFPSGDYKLVITLYNDEDDLFAELSAFFSRNVGGKYEF